jgi:hypothetical protein
MSVPMVMTSLMLAVALFLTGPVGAETPGSARLEGRLPDTIPVVSVDQTRGSVLDALDAISKQAGWSLVVTAPESVASRPLAIRITKRPATDALNLVLEAGALRATFADGVLKVRPDVPATRGSERERRRESRRAERRHSRGADRVVVGESLRIGADEVIGKAVAVGGSLTVLGHVRGDAVAVGGSVTLLPGARVDGDAVAIGGTVTVEEGASLEGDNVSVGGTIPAIVGAVTGWPVGDGHHLRSVFGFAGRLARSLLLFGVALLVAVVFPSSVARVRTFLTTRPGLSSLGGLALLLGFIPLCVLLAVTIIGIPLIPVAVMLLIAVLLFGVTVSALWLGERIPLLGENKTPLKAVALGSAVFVIVGLVPWIGTLAIFLAALVAAGATLLSRFGRRVEDQAA